MTDDRQDTLQPEGSVQQLLSSLPVVAPPDDGWNRIMAARLDIEQSRNRRYRRYLQLAGVAALMVITLITGFMVGQRSGQGSLSADSNSLQALMIESRILEQQLQVLTASNARHHDDRLLKRQQTHLTRLDAQLNSAYEQGLDDDQMTRLWQQRAALISDMISTFHASQRRVEQI